MALRAGAAGTHASASAGVTHSRVRRVTGVGAIRCPRRDEGGDEIRGAEAVHKERQVLQMTAARPCNRRGAASPLAPHCLRVRRAVRSFTKFCKDAGLWIDKGNKFNTKPPNRVDYVFTYACTNGPEGRRGNKEMSAAQFTFALRGVAKETGWSLDEVEERAKNCSVQLNATEAISTRFHDDKSNYTGSHKHMHADVSGQSPITDKAQIRRNRTLNALPLDTRMEALKLDNMIGEIFMKHDKNRSGLLEPEELESALKAMQPDADVSSMRVVSAYCLRDDNDGKLSLDEFKVAFNM